MCSSHDLSTFFWGCSSNYHVWEPYFRPPRCSTRHRFLKEDLTAVSMISPRISTQPDYSFTASRLIWKLDYSSLLPCVSSAFQILEMMRRRKKSEMWDSCIIPSFKKWHLFIETPKKLRNYERMKGFIFRFTVHWHIELNNHACYIVLFISNSYVEMRQRGYITLVQPMHSPHCRSSYSRGRRCRFGRGVTH